MQVRSRLRLSSYPVVIVSVKVMRALRSAGMVHFELGVPDYLVFNNALAWIQHGANCLDGTQYEERLGVPESVVDELFAVIHAGHRGRDKRAAFSLDDAQVLLLARALDEAVDGPAALPPANGMSHDWALIGASEEEFWAVRNAVRELAATLRGN